MATKVTDLTVDELKEVIENAVKDSLEDAMEDLKALSSQDYLRSIQDARDDYKKGKVKKFEDVF
jgi:hypothetical protein